MTLHLRNDITLGALLPSRTDLHWFSNTSPSERHSLRTGPHCVSTRSDLNLVLS